MKVGIVGGTGGMGCLFAEVFRKAGHDVSVSGSSTKLTNKDLAKQSDLVMISVPIHLTVNVINEIAPLMSEKQVLCDITSLKKEPIKAMLHSEAEIIGLHPMFGPSVASLKGQTIIAMASRCSEKSFNTLISIFEGQGAVITLSTPEEHDKMMAVIQGLTHFKALVMAETMRRFGVSPKDTVKWMSPVYRIEMNVAGRLLAQEPDLYGDILELNPCVREVLSFSVQAAEDLFETVKSGNRDEFREMFLKNREWFGEYCEKAMKESDEIIKTMVK